jgi:site-specific DNA-methyltransferase (adenine-specific)
METKKPEPSLNKMNKKQLLEKCTELGITRCKNKTKQELLALISQRNEGGNGLMMDETVPLITPTAPPSSPVETRLEIIHGDCLLEMQKIKDKSVDMILCDLPYGMTQNAWDTVIPFEKLWEAYNRVIKENGAIVLFGSQPFTSIMITSNLKMFRYCLVWEKNKFSDFLNAKKKPMKTNEDIAVFYKKQPTYNPQYWYSTPYTRWNTQTAVDKQTNYGSHKENYVESLDGKRLPTTVLKFNRIERPKHPTQKPVDLLEWLIKTYTNEGDLVLDNCMGVGSTGMACKNTNRSFIGIELDKKYFDIAYESIYA